MILQRQGNGIFTRDGKWFDAEDALGRVRASSGEGERTRVAPVERQLSPERVVRPHSLTVYPVGSSVIERSVTKYQGSGSCTVNRWCSAGRRREHPDPTG